MGKKQFCFIQTAETGNRTPDSGVKGSGANHYPRAPALLREEVTDIFSDWLFELKLIHKEAYVFVDAVKIHPFKITTSK